MPEALDSLSDRLRFFRERAGLTQEELAERAGLTVHGVSALERGVRTRPYPHTLRSIATALGLSEDDSAALVASVPRRRPSSARPAVGGSEAASLVVAPTRLHGRERDVAEVARLVKERQNRLITLIGPGGVGKTRLAAAVAHEVLGNHPDGVVTVPMAALADARQVVPAIHAAVGAPATQGPGSVESVVEHLRGRRLLLLLDNAEHLLDAAADLARLVSELEDITVLVTSRAPLRVRGEQEYVVEPLALPDVGATSTEALARSPAGALLLDRAREVSPRIELTDADVAALARLCHRLAGLPLALELAAAHLRLLSPAEVMDQLDELAPAAARDLPVRQRSMSSTIDWSYRLLSPQEQHLFRLMGAFHGGATLPMLRQVAEDCRPPGARNVVALLAGLVEHSLVLVREDAGPDRHYDMLQPIGEHARSLLRGEEQVRAYRAHARACLEFVEAVAADYGAGEQVLALRRIVADEGNVLTAIDRCLDSGDGESAGRMAWALSPSWWLRGQAPVALPRAQRCLGLDLTLPVRGRVELTAAAMWLAMGDIRSAAQHWQAALESGTENDDRDVVFAARAGLGLAALATGDLVRAEAMLGDSLALADVSADSGLWLRSLVHVWLGTARLAQGRPRDALVEIERGLDLAQARGERFVTYVALYNLTQAALALGDVERARGCLAEGVVLAHQTEDLAHVVLYLDAAVVVAAARGALETVAVLVGATEALREAGAGRVYGYYVTDESRRLAAVDLARTSLGLDVFEDLVDTGRSLDPEEFVALLVHGDGAAPRR